MRVQFTGRGGPYGFKRENVMVLHGPAETVLDEHEWVEADGARCADVAVVQRFTTPSGHVWIRVVTADGRLGGSWPETEVTLLRDGAAAPGPAQVLGSWRQIVDRLPGIGKDPNPLATPYRKLTSVHPDSVLARYLAGTPIEAQPVAAMPIFPFSSNLSQRAAIGNALTYPISVIEGPPGTGKTQTILNLVATLVADPGRTVGVVSLNNAAVDNVRTKLEQAGFGHVVARLGSADLRKAFFEAQEARNAAVRRVSAVPAPDPDLGELADLGDRLQRLQIQQLRLARQRSEADAHRLELLHFDRFLGDLVLPDLDGVALLRRGSERLLEFLAETDLDDADRRLGWLRRLQRRWRFGALRGADPHDADVVLSLQRSYYVQRIAELDTDIARLERDLAAADLDAVVERHRMLSEQAFSAGLLRRYGSREPRTYGQTNYLKRFSDFTDDYPVILSSCHSLRASIGGTPLLDCLIIDEASQVDLLTAALALASCRRVVVVGDRRQLPHIADADASKDVEVPAAAYDYRAHSILSSLHELYGKHLPATLLREHYRCHPAIIGFCNERFYDGQLLPLKQPVPDGRPLEVVRTVEGNHMRRHREGGLTNEREIDVIRDEVLPEHCRDVPAAEVGIITPYRRQADKAAGYALGEIETDTVHRFQGREKRVIIMSTVLDGTDKGRTGIAFADDPHLVNVAVSRATDRFILVTDHGLLPTSRNLKDLIGYVQYQDPDQEIVQSTVVSIFDLLYRNYSAYLRPLAARLRGEQSLRSEDIAWTVLLEILAEPGYEGHHAVAQVLLRNLVREPARFSRQHQEFLAHRSSVDLVVYNRTTRLPLLAIEVDGFAHHENNPAQRRRDRLKDELLAGVGLPLLRLPTTGSSEPDRIRRALDAALATT